MLRYINTTTNKDDTDHAKDELADDLFGDDDDNESIIERNNDIK